MGHELDEKGLAFLLNCSDDLLMQEQIACLDLANCALKRAKADWERALDLATKAKLCQLFRERREIVLMELRAIEAHPGSGKKLLELPDQVA